MQYMLLLYHAETGAPNPTTEAEVAAMMAPWFKYTADLKAAGAFVAGDPLKPTSTATTLRIRNGDVTTTDGPFAETTEALGGYYLINAADLDEALKWAAQCPGALFGSVEVRPVATIG